MAASLFPFKRGSQLFMRFLRHCIIMILEGFAFLLALLTFGSLLLVGRLMYGPLTITTLTPWIEQVISQPQLGMAAHISQTMLTWDRDNRNIVLALSNVQVMDSLGQKIANVPELQFVLSPTGYIAEQHSPWVVMVRHPHMQAQLGKDGKLKFGAVDMPTSLPQEQDSKTTMLGLQNAATVLQDLIRAPHARVAGLGLFANINMEDFELALQDEANGHHWDIRVPQLNLKRIHNDYQGKATLTLQRAETHTEVGFTLVYRAAEGHFHAVWSFDHLNPEILGEFVRQLRAFNFISSPLTGTIALTFNDALEMFDGRMNLNLDAGALNLPDIYQAPLPFKGGQMVVSYDGSKRKWIVEPVRLDLEKAVMKGSANIDVAQNPRVVSMFLSLENLSVEALADYWPLQAATHARNWVTANIHGGTVDGVRAELRLAVPEGDVASTHVRDVAADFSLRDAALTFWPPMPDIEKVSAKARITEKDFDVKITTGEVGAIKLNPSHLLITGLSEDKQVMSLEANLQGPTKDLLTILDREPLGYAKKMHIKPDDVSGEMEGTLTMSFPLLKDLSFDQMEINTAAKVTKTGIRKVADLVEVRDGEAAITVDKNMLTFEGRAVLNGLPSTVKWEERFVRSAPDQPLSEGIFKTKANLEALKSFGVEVPFTSSAAFPLEATYQRYTLGSKLAVSADVKETQLDFPTYIKPVGDAAQLSTVLEWGDGKPMRLSALELEGKDVLVKGKGQFDAGGHLSALTLDPLQLGASKARLEFSRGKDGVPFFKLNADVLDIQELLAPKPDKPEDGKAPEAPTPLRMDAQIKHLITDPKNELSAVSFSGERDTINWLNLNLSAKAGATPLSVTLSSKNDRSLLSATTPDLGNVLRALAITDTMTGGRLQIEGKSEAGDKSRNILGHIKLENYHVRKMPVLATLISAISPDGFAELVTGQGLAFGELNGDFMWGRDAIVLSKLHTAVGSLGLTSAGKIDLTQDRLELEGQVIPVYFINRILSAIPVIGDLLTGGENQGVFAATYRIDGKLSKPRVVVNPVAVLAPGFLRTILFMDNSVTKPGFDKKPVVTAPSAKKTTPPAKTNFNQQ